MNLAHKALTTFAVVLTGVIGLTGCGGTQSSNTPPTSLNSPGPTSEPQTGSGNASTTGNSTITPASTTNSTSNTTDNTTGAAGNSPSSMAAAVKTAMSGLPAAVKTGALVPTQFPQPENGDTQITYTVTDSTQPSAGVPPYVSDFSIALKSSSGILAKWTETHYASANLAAQGYQALADSGNTSTSSAPKIVLPGPGNQTASVIQGANGSTSLDWSKDQWDIRVTNTNTSVPPTPLADEVASYLSKNQMPVPHTHATILISSDVGTNQNVNVKVLWQENGDLYEVSTSKAAASPIETALGMAISMQPSH